MVQVYITEYVKSVQQIPAGFVTFTALFDKFSSLEIFPYHLLSLILFHREVLLAWSFLTHFLRNSYVGLLRIWVKKQISLLLIFLQPLPVYLFIYVAL